MSKTPYKAKGQTATINFFQSLLNKESEGAWTKHLDPKEVAFIYDMVSNANSFNDFSPTAAQSKWAVSIKAKIELIKKSQSGIGKNADRSSDKKRLSSNPKPVSRREALAFCKRNGIEFDKSSPKDIEIAMGLYDLKEVKIRPTKKNAIKTISSWRKLRASN